MGINNPFILRIEQVNYFKKAQMVMRTALEGATPTGVCFGNIPFMIHPLACYGVPRYLLTCKHPLDARLGIMIARYLGTYPPTTWLS